MILFTYSYKTAYPVGDDNTNMKSVSHQHVNAFLDSEPAAWYYSTIWFTPYQLDNAMYYQHCGLWILLPFLLDKRPSVIVSYIVYECTSNPCTWDGGLENVA